MRGNNLSDTSLRTMKNNPNCPQNSTDISHYGNELMESVNPNTFNNLGLPRGLRIMYITKSGNKGPTCALLLHQNIVQNYCNKSSFLLSMLDI